MNKTLLELVNKFSKFAIYQINTQKSVVFLHANSEQSKMKLRNNFIYSSIKKNKIPRNKLNESGKRPVRWKLQMLLK